MPACVRSVRGLASLLFSTHRPHTALGKLAGEICLCIARSTGGEFPTVPQPRVRVRKNRKEFDGNETNGITQKSIGTGIKSEAISNIQILIQPFSRHFQSCPGK